MKIHTLQWVVYTALSAVLLLGPIANAQQPQPRVALKLSSEAHEKQQTDPNFIASLVQRAGPQGIVAGPALNVSVSSLIGAQLSAQLTSKPSFAPKSDTLNFDLWYQIQVESATATQNERRAEDQQPALPQNILDLIHGLHRLPEVTNVHALYPGPPPAVDPSDDPRSSNQGYLDAAPTGINARYAWGFAGGDGAGVNIIDVEQGWNLQHEDLAAAGITLISGQNLYYFGHGTSVLGEMLMVDNQLGGIGIVPAAKGRVVSQHRDDFSYNTPAAILDAAAHSSFGDIILLEAQEFDPVSGVYYWPVSIADATYEAIRLATNLGVTVVEAGCNGGYDLDAYTNLDGKRIFDRSSPDYRESGSIMVGGGNSIAPHTRWYGSNYGSRIDVYAWAESIDTTNTDDTTGTGNWYTSWFSGTSGASPIIVGSAAIVQGISNAINGMKLAPLELRTILATNGTPSADPAIDRIGVMPDLKAIIDTHFNGGSGNTTIPDIYIRDHVGDTGETTPDGFVSSSPDIIVRQQPISNPSTALGTGSGTESNPALSEPVLAAHNHSLYVRVLNRGDATSSPTSVTLYWSEPATLVTPSLWHEIGTTTISPSIASNQLDVSPVLDWPASAVPGAGHYCFVAVAGTEGDPAPNLPATFPDFVKFVRERNNVAWRNFNVVSARPDGTASGGNGDGWHYFPVHVPGAWDADREFSVRFVGSLPKGSKVRLLVPKELGESLGMKGCERRGKGEDKDRKEVLVALQPSGTGSVGTKKGGVLAKGSLAKCELQIKVPGDVYGDTEGKYEFSLVQEWEGLEVGRVTWRFGAVVEL